MRRPQGYSPVVSVDTPSDSTKTTTRSDRVRRWIIPAAAILLGVTALGIRRRLDAAYHLTVLALVVGIAGSLLKGADYEEALALGLVLAAVVPARGHSFRRAALTSEPLTPGWIAALTLAIAATLWLGLFSYGRAPYSNDLWWRFATAADAPRFLRAMAGTTAVIVAFSLARLMRPGMPRGVPPAASDLARAKAVAMSCPDVRAHLALLGDKSLLFSETGRSFIMYGVSGRSWVALGDPIGPPAEHNELAWRFREMAHRHGGWPVFYQVSRDMLPLCIDLGLTLLKLGEEAHVPLASFSLDGGSRRGLRRTVHEVERTGTTFEIVGPEYVERLLPELEAVSNDWLAAKRTREKGFSLGFFDADYLVRLRASSAGARVASARPPRIPPRRALLSLSRPQTIQGKVRPDLGAEISRGAGRLGDSADTCERDRARVGWLEWCGEEMKARALFVGCLIPWALVASSGPCSAQSASSSRPADDVTGLPLHVVETKAASPITMAVFLTGDGGWASLDRRIAGDFAARGVPVVGVDSRAYLKTERTPEEAASDIARVIRKYTSLWAVQRVALVGYSRGADLAPFVANRLPSDVRHEITLVALLGPSERANFQFHWVDMLTERSRPSDRPILPELERLRRTPVLCVYGKDEKESLCRLADTSAVRVNQRPGDHHFDGDYDAIATAILGLIAPVNADGR